MFPNYFFSRIKLVVLGYACCVTKKFIIKYQERSLSIIGVMLTQTPLGTRDVSRIPPPRGGLAICAIECSFRHLLSVKSLALKTSPERDKADHFNP